MLKYFILLLVVSMQGSLTREIEETTQLDGYKAEERVVGGKDAPDGAVPHQVALRLPNDNNWQFCGAAIIDKRWILTAAHCLVSQKPDNVVAAVGTNQRTRGGTEYKISKFIIHESYDTVSFANDIALILTKEEIEYTAKVKPIKLASRDTKAGATCLLTGWGYVNQRRTRLPEKLQWLNVTAISVTECQNSKLKIFQDSNPITEKQICTLNKAGEGLCQGDSGGSLVEQNETVGVVSYNVPCARGFPDVYARVFKYLDWIKARMDENME